MARPHATQAVLKRPRATCLACFRPQAQCYCDQLVRVDNRTEVVIVQHPNERFHPFGTARMVVRCLERAHLAVDYDRSLREGRRALALPEGAALLFPGPDARDLATIHPDERPSALVVLDGTWHQARALYRDLPALQALPKVSFETTQPSRYRIRRQPRPECVSTIEATVRALELLEPETRGTRAMLDAFAAMIDLQLDTLARHPRSPRHARPRQPRGHGLPEWIRSEAESIVLIHGESAFIGDEALQLTGRALAGQPKALIQWVAKRLDTGELFSGLIRPPSLPLERRLCPTGLTANDLLTGVSLEAARDAWRAWLRPGDHLVSWNRGTLDDLEALGRAPKATFLKGVYKDFANRCDPRSRVKGSIGDIVAREQLDVAPLAIPGRSALRLAQLEALTRLLRETAINWDADPPPESGHRSRGGRNAANRGSSVASA
ncbi:MAG: DTW domain-containing protein [bacterium]|nr:DTW domain-containing protein [bacterium]